MIVSLALIAVLAAAALAGVYLMTKESIDNVQATKKQSALNAVLPGFDGSIIPVPTTVPGDKDPVVVNVAVTKDKTLFGAAVETYTNKAFGGTFTLMVGFDVDGNIFGTEVVHVVLFLHGIRILLYDNDFYAVFCSRGGKLVAMVADE